MRVIAIPLKSNNYQPFSGSPGPGARAKTPVRDPGRGLGLGPRAQTLGPRPRAGARGQGTGPGPRAGARCSGPGANTKSLLVAQNTRAIIFKAPYIVSTAGRRPAKTFFLFESWGYVASDAGGQFYLRFHRSVVVGMPRRQRQNRLLGRPLRSTRSSLLWRPLRPRGSQLTSVMRPVRPRKIRPRKSSMLGRPSRPRKIRLLGRPRPRKTRLLGR